MRAGADNRWDWSPPVQDFAGRFMRFTSLVVELIRARPRLVVCIVLLLQAALWLFVPLVFYSSPPGDLATVLAYSRWSSGRHRSGLPLAFWLADIAFRAAGNHLIVRADIATAWRELRQEQTPIK